jgi:hypothetical protein
MIRTSSAKRPTVIGLYVNPPAHAAVFCVDEKTAIQALDRKDPVLPLSPGRARHRRHQIGEPACERNHDSTVQEVPSPLALGLSMTDHAAKAGPECPHMAMDQPDSMPVPAPCKGIMLDCVKQMGCLGIPALPDRSASVSVPIAYSIVAYWAPCPALLGRGVKPNLFPPIAI